MRQCPNRYTFRAGRNLPDKEFRYLRTVIVTAAVYWGFSSELRLRQPLSLTFQHGQVSPSYFALRLRRELCFAKQSLGPIHCGFPLRKHPFSRSYGVILPSSLTRVLSHTLDSLLAYLCRFAVQAPFISLEAFLGSGESKTSPIGASPSQLSLHDKRICLLISLTAGRAQPIARFFYPSASLHCSNDKEVVQEYQPVVHRLRLSASA